MTFCIITHVNHCQEQNQYFAYAPYVREMNIWLQFVDEVIIVAPLEKTEKTAIDIAYDHDKIIFKKVPAFNVTGLKQIALTIFSLPVLFYTIFKAMQKAHHIHLRCPGNMGLIGAIVQMLFPRKQKTAKYAGNWDPKSKQPWSYRLQKWILSNTYLTKNMHVLVYGEWPNQSKNINSFFTATYAKEEINNSVLKLRSAESYKFIFVGTLSKGKGPLYAIQLVEQLNLSRIKVSLDLYGEGDLRNEIETYIEAHNLAGSIVLKGNQNKETIKVAYQTSHFLVLPSKSEGWPKVVAEAMFWGCVPLITPVSCVPHMLDFGKRGVLLTENIQNDKTAILQLINDSNAYQLKSKAAQKWSQHYTTDLFEGEIKKLLA